MSQSVEECDRGLPWRVALSFNVSQVGKELPELLKLTFDAGTVRDRGDGVHYFEGDTSPAAGGAGISVL